MCISGPQKKLFEENYLVDEPGMYSCYDCDELGLTLDNHPVVCIYFVSCTDTHTHTHTTYTHTHIHTCTHPHTYTHTHIHTYTYIHTYTHPHAHTHTHIDADIHTYTHIHEYTHIPCWPRASLPKELLFNRE